MSMRASSAVRRPAPAPAAEDRLDPNRFLHEAWTGSGDLFGPTGARVATFMAESRGLPTGDTRRALQDWTVSSGYAQRLDWRLTVEADGAFHALDVRTGVEAAGRPGEDGAFRWTASVRRKTRFGLQTLRIEAVIRLVGPDLIETEAVVTMLGVLTVGRMVGVWRRA